MRCAMHNFLCIIAVVHVLNLVNLNAKRNIPMCVVCARHCSPALTMLYHAWFETEVTKNRHFDICSSVGRLRGRDAKHSRKRAAWKTTHSLDGVTASVLPMYNFRLLILYKVKLFWSNINSRSELLQPPRTNSLQ